MVSVISPSGRLQSSRPASCSRSNERYSCPDSCLMVRLPSCKPVPEDESAPIHRWTRSGSKPANVYFYMGRCSNHVGPERRTSQKKTSYPRGISFPGFRGNRALLPAFNLRESLGPADQRAGSPPAVPPPISGAQVRCPDCGAPHAVPAGMEEVFAFVCAHCGKGVEVPRPKPIERCVEEHRASCGRRISI